MDERRQVPRNRTLKSGKIIVHANTSLVDCTVRNLSPKGALLAVGSPVGLPTSFQLILERDHTRRDCRVIWRGKDRLGVEFAVSAGTADGAGPNR